jgi:hypothetical protein
MAKDLGSSAPSKSQTPAEGDLGKAKEFEIKNIAEKRKWAGFKGEIRILEDLNLFFLRKVCKFGCIKI